MWHTINRILHKAKNLSSCSECSLTFYKYVEDKRQVEKFDNWCQWMTKKLLQREKEATKRFYLLLRFIPQWADPSIVKICFWEKSRRACFPFPVFPHPHLNFFVIWNSSEYWACVVCWKQVLMSVRAINLHKKENTSAYQCLKVCLFNWFSRLHD